jgi:hypothetical protein
MDQTISVRRMFADIDGETGFDTVEISLDWKEHVPPAAPFLAAQHQKAVSYTFFRLPAKWKGTAHSAPFKLIVVCLSGEFSFQTSTGEIMIMRPGSTVMETATTGKGHVTEVLSQTPVECLIVRLE